MSVRNALHLDLQGLMVTDVDKVLSISSFMFHPFPFLHQPLGWVRFYLPACIDIDDYLRNAQCCSNTGLLTHARLRWFLPASSH